MRLWILFPTAEEAFTAFPFSTGGWQRFGILEYFQIQNEGFQGFAFLLGVGKEAEVSLDCLWQFAKTQPDGNPDWVILAGFAGACRPGMKTGAMFIVKDLIGIQGDGFGLIKSFSVPSPLDSMPLGVCISITEVAGIKVKEEFGLQGADLVEMELGWIWESFEKRGVPLVSLRVILDELYDSFPAGIEEIMERGRVRVLRLLKWVVCNALGVPGLFRLKSKVGFAQKRLSKELDFMISRLY